MIIIKPIEIDVNTLPIDTGSLSATTYYDKFGIGKTATVAWSSTTSYNINNVVRYKDRVYQSVFNGANLNRDPIINNVDLATEVKYWVEIAILNRWAAFDTKSNTQTRGEGFILSYRFTPNETFDSIGFTNVDVDYITVQIMDTSPEVELYRQTRYSRGTRVFTNWYEWATLPFPDGDNMLFRNIPPLANKEVRISFVKTSTTENFDPPKVGGIILGKAVDVGAIELGATLPFIDYSVINTDEFGNTSFLKRNSFNGFDGYLRAPAVKMNSIISLRKTITSSPTIFSGINEENQVYYNSLFLMGVATTFEPIIDSPTEFRIKLTVKGI
jgi:hypothetical protein